MKKRLSVLAAGFVCAAMVVPGVASAKSPFLNTFNNKYGTSATKLNTCSVCHTAVPSLNPYGNAFKNKWKSGLTVGQALGAIQPLDSDRDTFSNIKEIRARTFPGRKASHP
jgi:hypothetical protein